MPHARFPAAVRGGQNARKGFPGPAPGCHALSEARCAAPAGYRALSLALVRALSPLLVLAFALALALARPQPATGAEFTALGHWMFGVNAGNVYGQRTADVRDHVQAVQRLRTQFGFVAAHGLNGQVQLEMGKTNWGQAASGGALGADASLTKLRHAWLEWDMPWRGGTARMGIQPVNMPSFVNGSPLFSEDAAGVVVSQALGERLDITAFWVRASAGNENPPRGGVPACNELDFFGLALPLAGDSFRISPYGMLVNAGINAIGSRVRSGTDWTLAPYKSSLRTVGANLTPVGGLALLADPGTAQRLRPWGNAWWGGLGGETDAVAPWHLAGEWAFGSADFGSVTVRDRRFAMRRQGWYGAVLAEYALGWMVPGVLAWYSSGDDDNPWNGSERMPVGKSANRDWKVLNLAYDGAPFCPDGGAQIISPNGTMIGTWGVVGRLNDLSLVPGLRHTLRAGYVRGTNAPGMVTDNPFFTDSRPGGYLTTKDEAIEVDVETRLRLYENLTLILDADWLRVNWDSHVWARFDKRLERDFYRLGLTAYYHF